MGVLHTLERFNIKMFLIILIKLFKQLFLFHFINIYLRNCLLKFISLYIQYTYTYSRYNYTNIIVLLLLLLLLLMVLTYPTLSAAAAGLPRPLLLCSAGSVLHHYVPLHTGWHEVIVLQHHSVLRPALTHRAQGGHILKHVGKRH